MATTTNFGWTVPADTDLVKDGAAAIRTALGGVDTSFVDLKGGTTGQVLAKASNTDLDYSWVAVDPLVILDAKGDLISATAADTPARLAVGSNDQVLTADSTTATGLKWASPPAGGGYTLLSTTTLSGSNQAITSINQTYKHLFVLITGMNNATADGNLQVLTNGSAGGANWSRTGSVSSTASTGALGNDVIQCNINAIDRQNSTDNAFAIMYYNYATATVHPFNFQTGYKTGAGTRETVNGGGVIMPGTGPSAITSITLNNTGGAFTAGTCKIYGVN
jgi:hypothetical protein